MPGAFLFDSVILVLYFNSSFKEGMYLLGICWCSPVLSAVNILLRWVGPAAEWRGIILAHVRGVLSSVQFMWDKPKENDAVTSTNSGYLLIWQQAKVVVIATFSGEICIPEMTGSSPFSYPEHGQLRSFEDSLWKYCKCDCYPFNSRDTYIVCQTRTKIQTKIECHITHFLSRQSGGKCNLQHTHA